MQIILIYTQKTSTYVSSVPHHCVPSEISTAMPSRTETWSVLITEIHFYVITLRRGRPREQLLLQNYKA